MRRSQRKSSVVAVEVRDSVLQNTLRQYLYKKNPRMTCLIHLLWSFVVHLISSPSQAFQSPWRQMELWQNKYMKIQWFPIGIDADCFIRALDTLPVQEHMKELKERFASCEVKLTILIEDPRDVERRRLFGIQDHDAPSFLPRQNSF